MAAVIVAGCGDGRPRGAPVLNVAPAAGIVTFKGKPLAHYTVNFTPAGKEGFPAVGVTDESGKFSLGTNVPGDGAVVGKYSVTVAYAGPRHVGDHSLDTPIDDPAKMPKPPATIPEKYGNTMLSGITVDVPAGGKTDIKIDLE
ncbi:MAG TPA: hypothetical protein VNC50_04920 [Planctomycetia bacterium]|nr:hypothetical protein [Planctomycetia bacterium]